MSRGVDNDEFGYNPRKKYAASARKNVPPVRKHLPTPKLHVEQVQPPTRDEAYFAGLKQNKMLNTQRERVVREARLEQMGNEEFIHFTIDEIQYSARLNSENVKETKNGKNYNFWFDMKKCHIFDYETEENISLI